MTDKDMSFYTGHRQRLRQKFIDGKTTDYELLESLLGYAIPRRDVRPLSRALIARYGSVPAVLSAPLDDLMSFNGVGFNTAVFLKQLHEISKMDFQFTLSQQPIFLSHDILANYCRVMLADKRNEEFHVLFLDKTMHLIKDALHSSGTIDWSAVYPEKIVRDALNMNATNLVLVHNHPSGTDQFSDDDKKLTERLLLAISGLPIRVYDHLLVAGEKVCSFNATYPNILAASQIKKELAKEFKIKTNRKHRK